MAAGPCGHDDRTPAPAAGAGDRAAAPRPVDRRVLLGRLHPHRHAVRGAGARPDVRRGRAADPRDGPAVRARLAGDRAARCRVRRDPGRPGRPVVVQSGVPGRHRVRRHPGRGGGHAGARSRVQREAGSRLRGQPCGADRLRADRARRVVPRCGQSGAALAGPTGADRGGAALARRQPAGVRRRRWPQELPGLAGPVGGRHRRGTGPHHRRPAPPPARRATARRADARRADARRPTANRSRPAPAAPARAGRGGGVRGFHDRPGMAGSGARPRTRRDRRRPADALVPATRLGAAARARHRYGRPGRRRGARVHRADLCPGEPDGGAGG